MLRLRIKLRVTLHALRCVRCGLVRRMLSWTLNHSLTHCGVQAEFRAAAIQKVHGLKSKGDKPTGASRSPCLPFALAACVQSQ